MASRSRIGGVLVDFQPMSPEEIQRMMQFLLNQQALFAADLAKTEALVAQISAKTDRISDGLLSLTGVVGVVAENVAELAAAQRRTDEQLQKGDAELREYIKTVESHLDALIDMFERHLLDDHGIQPS